MTTYPNLSLTLPTRGATGSGHWADVLDANTAKIDAHDHTSGKGLRIKSAALNIDGDVSFSSTWAITALNRVSLSAVVAPIVNRSLFCKSADGELYWLSATGTQVKMTSGSSLNVAAFTGGIGGDYTAVAAALNYDDSAKRYTHKGAAGTNWARLQSGPVRIAELDTAETVFVEQAAPAALAASYTMTWPTALPGSTLLAQIDATGQWIFSNTVSQLITAGAGLTASANQHITVSGTGSFKHGTKTMSVPFSEAVGSTIAVYDVSNGAQTSAGSVGIFLAIRLDVGKRITAVRAFVVDNATGTTKLQASLVSNVAATGTGTIIASSALSSGAGARQTLSVTGLTTTIVTGTTYSVFIQNSGGTAVIAVYGAEVDYDGP